MLPHSAVRDVHYRGIDIAEGERVDVLVPAVNRDPAAVERPHEFDITRPRVRNFSFGQGAHVCPAATLARVEMSIALERLVQRIGSMRLVDVPEVSIVGKGRVPESLLVGVDRA